MQQATVTFGEITRRLAVPFFLFALVLFLLLGLSWILLVPALTHVEVGGTLLGLEELKDYRSQMESQIVALEDDRSAFLRPVRSAAFDRLLARKAERAAFQDIRTEVARITRELVPNQKDAFFIESINANAAGKSVELRGRVQHVGPRSMTVLAEFVEALRAVPFVTDVRASRFVRSEHPDLGFISPFALRLTLR